MANVDSILVRTVISDVVEDWPAGIPHDVWVVREAVQGSETDICGRPCDVISVTEDPAGYPVRITVNKSAPNSAGIRMDTLPVAFTI